MPRHTIWGERRGCTLLPAGGALAAVTGRDPGDGRAVLAVFYNGDCGVCRTRITGYQAASIDRSRLIAEQGRSRDLGAAYRSQLADITKSYDQEIAMAAENTTDPKTTMGWANLVNRRSELEAELQNISDRFSAL